MVTNKKRKGKKRKQATEEALDADASSSSPQQQATKKKKKKKHNKEPKPKDEDEIAQAETETTKLSESSATALERTRGAKNNDETAVKLGDGDGDDDDAKKTLVKNPLLEEQASFYRDYKVTNEEREGFFSNKIVTPARRAELWMAMGTVGEGIVNRYGWATPTDRALHIIRHFQPIIEIGCGANAYWCRQMARVGIDIVGVEKSLEKGGKIDPSDKASKQTIKKGKGKANEQRKQNEASVDGALIRKGGPEVLEEDNNSSRTLFLCYPDENDEAKSDNEEEDEDEERSPAISLGEECLQRYKGQYVIHVGELFCGDANLSCDQAPWGRSSSPVFQQQLAAEFHCILRIALPNWLHTRDSLSVWKRSETCTIVFSNKEDDDANGDDGDDDVDAEEIEYRHVPANERLPSDIAAPCVEFLLQEPPGVSTSTENDGPSDLELRQEERSDVEEQEELESGSLGKDKEGYECPW